MESVLDNEDLIKKDRIGSAIMDSYRFWLMRRIWFNVAVGLTGLLPLLSVLKTFPADMLLAAFIWGGIANGLFSLGYSIDSFFIIRSKGTVDFRSLREILFWLGTVSYALVTYMVVQEIVRAYTFAYF